MQKPQLNREVIDAGVIAPGRERAEKPAPAFRETGIRSGRVVGVQDAFEVTQTQTQPQGIRDPRDL